LKEQQNINIGKIIYCVCNMLINSITPFFFAIVIKKYEPIVIFSIYFVIGFIILLKLIVGIPISYKDDDASAVDVFTHFISFICIMVNFVWCINDICNSNINYDKYKEMYIIDASISGFLILFIIFICIVRRINCDSDYCCDCSDCCNNSGSYGSGSSYNPIQTNNYENRSNYQESTYKYEYTQQPTYTMGYAPGNNTASWGYFNSSGSYYGPGSAV